MPIPFLPSLSDTSFIAAFLFVFAIVYAMLVKTRIIEIRGANIVIALVIGFFASSFGPLTQFLQSILPIAAVLLVIAFLIEFVRKIFGGAPRDTIPMVVALAVSLMLLAVLWDRITPLLPAGTDPVAMLWILGVLVVILIFYLVYKHT